MSTTRSIGSAKDTSSNAEVGGTRDNVELVEQPSNESPPFSKNEGGLEGYLTIAGCFLAFYASFGFVTAFGVFQSYYESVLPTHSADDISWIGSIQLWCITGIAIPSVVLNAHLGPHITIAIGTFFIVFGVMMASLSTQYYQLLLSHGICSGIGIGLSFLPVIGLPNQWYNKNRALAVGLALSGSSVGGLIWPIMINQMINYDHVGFPWTMRAIGFIQLALMATAIALIRNNVPMNKAVKLSSFPFAMALKQVGVATIGLSYLLLFLGIYIPWFYATLYAESLGASPATAFYMTSTLNVGTLFGRIVMGGVGDKMGPSNALLLCLFASAILSFIWQGVNNVPGLFVWTVVYGWFSGASISLQTPTMIRFVPEGKIQLIGPYIAIICQVSSFGALGGNPIAGALLQNQHRGRLDSYRPSDFHPIMWFTGAILLGSCVLLQAARYTHTPNLLAKA